MELSVAPPGLWHFLYLTWGFHPQAIICHTFGVIKGTNFSSVQGVVALAIVLPRRWRYKEMSDSFTEKNHPVIASRCHPFFVRRGALRSKTGF
jgi:hypothetical protein